MRHEGAKSAVALELMHHDELSDEPCAILYADCMMPERKRLARTLFLRVPLRSPEGISAMRDLIALRTNDSRIAYQRCYGM